MHEIGLTLLVHYKTSPFQLWVQYSHRIMAYMSESIGSLNAKCVVEDGWLQCFYLLSSDLHYIT